MEVGSILGMCRFTWSGSRPLKFMISGGDKSMTICTRQRGQRKHREEYMNTFLKKSKKRLITEFHRLV